MQLSTSHLILAPDAPIDFQLHTTYSDGDWTPEQLIDYLVGEQFGLVAVTDHDRVDTAAPLQQLALAKKLPILVAAEWTTRWHNEPTDVLCFGFDPDNQGLIDLLQIKLDRQSENTQSVCENLRRCGHSFSPDEVDALLILPGSRQPHAMVAHLEKQGHPTQAAWDIISEAGAFFVATDLALVVEANHASGGICLIAHPGRGNGYTRFDIPLLDELRCEIPIDGVEAYYPKHNPAQTTLYLDYAQEHHLLVSAGSDSHKPSQPPIKYRAEWCRTLLERLGVEIKPT